MIYRSSGASRAAELGAVTVRDQSPRRRFRYQPAARVPGFGVRSVGIHYFDWHHTDADSFHKIVPREFQLNVASLAVLSDVLADMPRATQQSVLNQILPSWQPRTASRQMRLRS